MLRYHPRPKPKRAWQRDVYRILQCKACETLRVPWRENGKFGTDSHAYCVWVRVRSNRCTIVMTRHAWALTFLLSTTAGLVIRHISQDYPGFLRQVSGCRHFFGMKDNVPLKMKSVFRDEGQQTVKHEISYPRWRTTDP